MEPLPGGRAPRRLPRSGRRWGPVAISLGLHGAALLIAVVWFAAVHQSGPVPRRLQLAAVDLADAEETEAVSTEQVSAPDLPPAELEVNIPDTLLLHDSPSEECELPECDFTSPDLEPSEFLDVPLSAAGESRPKAAAVVPPAEPRPAARRPIARPAQPASRPPSRPHRRTGRALRLVHRPNLMQYYPAEARRRGIEGEALVEIRVDTDGRVVEAVIIRSSGSALLDRQAIRLMYAYRFAAGDGGRSRVPVNFRLQ